MESRELSPAFKFASLILVALTIVFVLIAIGMSIGISNPTDSQKSAESWLFGAAASTLTALLGLFGGKVL